MKEFIITTESNCDLEKAFTEQNHIGVIPHYYTVEEEIYGEDKELTIEEFYQVMREEKPVGTMASNPAVIEEIFEGYIEEGKDILHLSTTLLI